jgi:hypothetical protein
MRSMTEKEVERLYLQVREDLGRHRKMLTALESIPDDPSFVIDESRLAPDELVKASENFSREMAEIFDRRVAPDFGQQFMLPVGMVPVPTVEAYYDPKEAFIGVSAGLIKLVNFVVTVNVTKKRFFQITDSLHGDVSPKKSLEEVNRLREMGAAYFSSMDYLMLRYLIVPFPLPKVWGQSQGDTPQRVNAAVEAVLSFILLHEFGHAAEAEKGKVSEPVAGLCREFPVHGEGLLEKEEEFLADAFVFQAVPEGKRNWLGLAAVLFFNLYLVYERAFRTPSSTHPTVAQRIHRILETYSVLFDVSTRESLRGSMANSQRLDTKIHTLNQLSLEGKLNAIDLLLERTGLQGFDSPEEEAIFEEKDGDR